MSAAAASKCIAEERTPWAGAEVRTRSIRALHLAHLPMLDGIRALAVLRVILYHFGFENSGGAAGVLVFFVFSGFLN